MIVGVSVGEVTVGVAVGDNELGCADVGIAEVGAVNVGAAVVAAVVRHSPHRAGQLSGMDEQINWTDGVPAAGQLGKSGPVHCGSGVGLLVVGADDTGAVDVGVAVGAGVGDTVRHSPQRLGQLAGIDVHTSETDGVPAAGQLGGSTTVHCGSGVGLLEIGAAVTGAADVGAADVGLADVGAADVGATDVGVLVGVRVGGTVEGAAVGRAVGAAVGALVTGAAVDAVGEAVRQSPHSKGQLAGMFVQIRVAVAEPASGQLAGSTAVHRGTGVGDDV